MYDQQTKVTLRQIEGKVKLNFSGIQLGISIVVNNTMYFVIERYNYPEDQDRSLIQSCRFHNPSSKYKH